jgi:hypothetical protein
MWTLVSFKLRNGLAVMGVAVVALGFSAASSASAAESEAHPDLSGIWGLLRHTGPQGAFFMPADPPLSANGKKVIDEFRAKYDVKKYDMEPNQYCVEHGMPSIMWGLGGAPMEIIQQPKRITLLSEATNQWRFFFLDGRKVPDEYPHTRNGYSVAQWDGDKLKVETTKIEEWKLARWPHSDNARFDETFYLMDAKDMPPPPAPPGARPGAGAGAGQSGNAPRRRPGRAPITGKVLVDEITMTDPDYYDKPESVTYFYRKLPNDDFFEDTCSTGIWWDEFEKRVAAGKPVGPQ